MSKLTKMVGPEFGLNLSRAFNDLKPLRRLLPRQGGYLRQEITILALQEINNRPSLSEVSTSAGCHVRRFRKGQYRRSQFALIQARNGRPEMAHHKPNLPEKTCPVCGRPFQWRKKWADVWEQVKYCSEACKKRRDGNQTGKTEKP
jgi:hypothetical protein